MISHCLPLALCGILLAAAAQAEQPANSPAIAPADSWDRYRVLAERNVFTRNRSHHAETASTAAEAPSAAAAPEASADEQSMTLTGVVRQRDEWVAFVEDGRTSTTTRVRPGESLGAGTVASIAFGGIEYYRGADRKAIAVGQNLAGLWPTPPPAPPAATPAAGPTATGATATATASAGTSTQVKPASGTTAAGSADVLERMRQRRAQELK